MACLGSGFRSFLNFLKQQLASVSPQSLHLLLSGPRPSTNSSQLGYTELYPFFSLCPPLPTMPNSLRQFPHHCSCPWVMPVSSWATPFPILYFTSLWLFCNYLFVILNPLPFTHSPKPSYHLATIKMLSIPVIRSLLLFA